MTEEQLNVICVELEEDLQLLLDVNNPYDAGIKNILKRHLKNGAFYLSSMAGEFDIDINLAARQYVINYARYSYYGILDEFYNNYQADLRGIQIENFE